MTTCIICGKPTDHQHNRRCLSCRVAAALRGWAYTPDARIVSDLYDDERAWAARPAEKKRIRREVPR